MFTYIKSKLKIFSNKAHMFSWGKRYKEQRLNKYQN
jgi:hypothetical protein